MIIIGIFVLLFGICIWGIIDVLKQIKKMDNKK
jgi:hypothetical protein